MTNAPVFYVLAQVRFNPVLTMASSIDQLQERWRSRYPDFSLELVDNLQVNFSKDGQTPEVKTISTPRWNFADADGTCGLSLTTESITLQTTRYQTAEIFISDLVSGVKTLHDCLSLAYVDGIGFRMLDAVIPECDRGLAFYLNPGLMGLYEQLDGEFMQSISQLTQKRVFGQVVTRTVLLNSEIGIPADLAPIKLQFNKKVKELKGIHAVLDNDVSQNDRFTFDTGEIERRLKIIKEGLNDAFYKSVTSSAIESWK